MELDWGDGQYETTARQLEPVAELVADFAGVRSGMKVLDVGCGTGNAMLAAARRGATVTGVDPSNRLLEVSRRRFAEEGLTGEWIQGDARDLSALSNNFDRVVAVFSIIFAPEPVTVAEQVASRLGAAGSVVFTSWIPAGAIHEMARRLFPSANTGSSPWAEEEGIRGLWEPHGEVEIHKRQHTFSAVSAESWFSEMEEHHPAWRAAKAAQADHWRELRRDCIDILNTHDEGDGAYQATSAYLLTKVTPRG